MENSLKKNMSQMAEEYTGTEVKKAFKDGAENIVMRKPATSQTGTGGNS